MFAFRIFRSSQPAKFLADSFHSQPPPFNLARRGHVEGNDFTRSMIVRGGRGRQETKLVRSVTALISMHFVLRV